ncbi:MAG: acyltransferase family protein [Pseudomonadota bacterium]
MNKRQKKIPKIAEPKRASQPPQNSQTSAATPDKTVVAQVDPRYRPDIDGLRAVAILTVLGFHFFPAIVTGGFIGVDIFFVISGYLISGILREQLEENRFSLMGFYSRRITRIFPALILVLLACFVYGWFSLLATDFKQLGKHIAGGAAFISNFQLLNETGYFAGAIETKPLLHLWSLSIEEQYYLVWPLLLWFAFRRGWNLIAVVLVLLVGSFALNITTVQTSPSAAFYLPQTRFWELFSGAALACVRWRANPLAPSLVTRCFNAQAQAIAGSSLIIAGLVFIKADQNFPGWWALLPTLGTVLLLSAGPKAFINHRFLANRGMVATGLISYPLYLWHWPLLSFWKIQSASKPSVESLLLVLCLSIVLAGLTYWLVERPFRFGKWRTGKAFWLFIAVLIIGAAGLQGYTSNGFDGVSGRKDGREEFAKQFENSPPAYAFYTSAGIHDLMRDDCNFSPNTPRYSAGGNRWVPRQSISKSCYERDGRPHAVFIWGDSHAQHLNAGLRDYLPEDWQVLQVATSSCPPYKNYQLPSTTDYCAQSNWFALAKIKETKPDVVIVAEHWGHGMARMNEITTRLTGMGVKKVIFMGPTPEWDTDLWRIVVQKLWVTAPERTFEGLKKDVRDANAALQKDFKASSSMELVDLFKVFCNQDGCLTRIGKDRQAITSYDTQHFSKVASDYLARTALVQLVTGSPPQKN